MQNCFWILWYSRYLLLPLSCQVVAGSWLPRGCLHLKWTWTGCRQLAFRTQKNYSRPLGEAQVFSSFICTFLYLLRSNSIWFHRVHVLEDYSSRGSLYNLIAFVLSTISFWSPGKSTVFHQSCPSFTFSYGVSMQVSNRRTKLEGDLPIAYKHLSTPSSWIQNFNPGVEKFPDVVI